jgi:hypothetical protein
VERRDAAGVVRALPLIFPALHQSLGILNKYPNKFSTITTLIIFFYQV